MRNMTETEKEVMREFDGRGSGTEVGGRCQEDGMGHV